MVLWGDSSACSHCVEAQIISVTSITAKMSCEGQKVEAWIRRITCKAQRGLWALLLHPTCCSYTEKVRTKWQARIKAIKKEGLGTGKTGVYTLIFHNEWIKITLKYTQKEKKIFKHLSVVAEEKKACLVGEKLLSVAVSPSLLLLILPDWWFL